MNVRAVLEALPEAIFTTDARGLITFYNNAAASLWGMTPQLGTIFFAGLGSFTGLMVRLYLVTKVLWPWH